MSRFNQWQKTDYLALPVDYYMQAGLQNDQTIETGLQKSANAISSYKALQPISADPKALHDQVLTNIKTEIQNLSKENLKSPDALMRLNSIVNNPEYVSSLMNIAKDTELYKTTEAAYKKHVEDNGNPVNASPFLEVRDRMAKETGDPTKFNASRFSGLDVMPKYIEIQKEVDDIVSKMEKNQLVWDEPSGAYIKHTDIKTLSPERIRAAVMHELSGRQDLAMQLDRNIRWDTYSSGKTISQQADWIRGNLAKDVKNIDFDLDMAVRDKNAFMKKYRIHKADDIAGVVELLKNQQKNITALAGKDAYELVKTSKVDNIVNASTAVWASEDKSKTLKVNGVWLQQNAHAFAREQQAQRDKLLIGQTVKLPDAIEVSENKVDEAAIKDGGTFVLELLKRSNVTSDDLKKLNLIPKQSGLLYDLSQNNRGIMRSNIDAIPDAVNTFDYKNLAGVKELAKIYGYNEKLNAETPIQYLEQRYRETAVAGTMRANSGINSHAQAKAIVNANGTVYVNGEMVTNGVDKQAYYDKLNTITGESGGPNAAKSQMGMYSYDKKTGISLVSYNIGGKKVSFELPGDLSAGLSGMQQGFKAASNPLYGVGNDAVDPADVRVPRFNTSLGVFDYDHYTAGRVQNGGAGVTYFKDADSRVLQSEGLNNIMKVADAIKANMSAAGQVKIKEGSPQYVYLINKAISLINAKFNEGFDKMDDGSVGHNSNLARTIKVGGKTVTLSRPLFIINNKFRNYNELLDNSLLRVGTYEGINDPTTKKYYGGANEEGTIHDRAFEGALNNMIKQYGVAKPMTLEPVYQPDYSNFDNE